MNSNGAGRVAGKVALVTGGSSGIGLAIAQRLAEEGAIVALVGSGDLAKTTGAADIIRAAGGRASPFVADVRDAGQICQLVERVTVELGDIDILINAAGVWFPTPLLDLNGQQIDQMVEINLKGVIRAVAAVAPRMVARKSGKIVNLASIAGTLPSAGFCLYSTVKAGVIAFTKAAALDLAPHDVAINAISPGNTATPMNALIRTDPAMESRREWIRRITPSNRMFTPPEEIAEATLFLVDGRVRGMHGAVIAIDEGRSAGLPAK